MLQQLHEAFFMFVKCSNFFNLILLSKLEIYVSYVEYYLIPIESHLVNPPLSLFGLL